MNAPLYCYGTTAGERILWMSYFVQGFDGLRGIPYLIIGDPGTVKTSAVRRLHQRAGLHFEPVIGSLHQAQDFLGVPMGQTLKKTDVNAHMFQPGQEELLYGHYAPVGFGLRAALKKRAGILFDEVNTSGDDVQAAMLRIVHERVVGELALPSTVRITLAMNEAEDTSHAIEISKAFANRIGWLKWEPGSLADYVDYLGATGARQVGATNIDAISTDDLEDSVDIAWPSAYAKAQARISGFLKFRPNLLHVKPKKDVKPGPWPSRRSWEFATRALTGSFLFGLSDIERHQACAAAVGDKAWAEFEAWCRKADLPDLEALLDKKASFQHKSAHLDVTAAVFDGCTTLLVGMLDKNLQAQRAAAMWEMLDEMLTSNPDATDLMLRPIVTLCKAKLMLRQPVAYKVMGRVQPTLSASGIDLGAFAQ